jgi:DNA-directed RNA polymerase I, II, and III subunit RPABC2
MSDIESDKEDYNSDNSDDEEFTSTTIKKQTNNPQKKSANNYGADIESDDDADEEDDDDDDADLNEDEDDNNSGIIDGEGEGEAKGLGDEDEDYYDDSDDNGSDAEDDDNEDSKKKASAPKVKQPIAHTTNYDYDDDDDDDDDDENYLQKFDNDINKNYILDNHPECLQHNYDEITCLSRIVRDKDNIIIDPLHKTIPILTKYERARILGQRAKQIESGAKPLVKVPDNIIDGYLIAELELREKKIPFIIKRPLPDGSCEYWNVKDLEVIIY